MDGTVTESRQDISGEIYVKLSKLATQYHLIVISGAEKERMVKQLQGLPVEIMAQSGNDTQYWQRTLNDNEKEKIFNHINKIAKVKPEMIDDRGCQIALSFTGHDAYIEDKKLFDPDGKKREKILKDNPFLSTKLECRIAGTTCLDYTRKDGTKGKNIERFIKVMGWKKDDCIYFGDKLMKGGNDESVINVIPVVQVDNPKDLMIKLDKYVN